MNGLAVLRKYALPRWEEFINPKTELGKAARDRVRQLGLYRRKP